MAYTFLVLNKSSQFLNFFYNFFSLVPVLRSLICKMLFVTFVSSFSELFNFGRTPETKAIIYTIVCVLCVLHVIIACLKWKNKQNCVFRDHKTSLSQLMHDSKGKYGLI